MARIEFFYDVGSPYTYLASTQIDALAERTRSELVWRPFLLGGVFKGAGNEAPARVAAKAVWMLGDLARWAAHYRVPFQMSSRFPLNTLSTQRALVAVDRELGHDAQRAFAKALFQAYWVDDRDVSGRAVLLEVLASVGLEASVLGAMDAPETKDRLRATTDEAVQRGAFGAPSVFVGDAMFFGNDRLVLLEEHVRALG